MQEENNENEEKILIKTEDNKNIQVSIKFLDCCENQSYKNRRSNIKIDFKYDVVSKVIEFLRMRKFENENKIPKPLPHGNLIQFLSEDDLKFLNNLEEDMIISLMKVSKELGIKSLYEILVNFIAGFFKDITVKEIYKEYADNPQDMNELEEQLRAEYLKEIEGDDPRDQI